MSDYRFQQRDFLGILTDIKDYYRSRLGDNWTDDSESDPAVALMEAFAYSMKNLHYYVDQQKRESDIVTAVRPRNVYWKAVRDGYMPHGYRCGTGTLTIRFGKDTTGGVTIPRGTVFQTDFGEGQEDIAVTTEKDIVISEDAIIASEGNEYNVEVVQGVWRTVSKTRADVTQNGYIKLPTDRVATDLGRVFVRFRRTASETVEWTQVEDVYTDYRSGYFFSVHPLFLRNSTVSMIQLPYNWQTLLDTDGEIQIEYLETLGDEGHIAPSKYDVVSGTYVGGVSRLNSVVMDSGNPAKPINGCIESIYNAMPITGGTSLEDVISIKTNAKYSMRDLKTLVTLKDYEAFVRMETASNASAMDISIDGSIPARSVYVFLEMDSESWTGYEEFDPMSMPSMGIYEYIDYYTGANADQSLNKVWNEGVDGMPHSYSDFWKGKFSDIVERTLARRGRRDVVVFMRPLYRWYEIKANVTLKDSGESIDSIMGRIKEMLSERLGQVPQIGKTHYMSDISAIIQRSSDRVLSVELELPDTDIMSSLKEIPRYRIDVGGIRFKTLDGTINMVLPEEAIES